MLTLDKSALVLDSCGFIHLSNSYIREKNLIDYLIYDLKINTFITSKIYEEILSLYSKSESYIQQADSVFKKEVFAKQNIKIKNPPKECIKIIRKETIKITSEIKNLKSSWLDKGERDAAALALFLSKKFNTTLLITGDFKAMEILHHIFRSQKIGDLKSSFDLCIFLYSRGLVDWDSTNKILLTINDILRESEIGGMKDNRLKKYRDQILELCNYYCDKKYCFA